MKTRKRLFAAILALVMILSTLPVSAAGENDAPATGTEIAIENMDGKEEDTAKEGASPAAPGEMPGTGEGKEQGDNSGGEDKTAESTPTPEPSKAPAKQAAPAQDTDDKTPPAVSFTVTFDTNGYGEAPEAVTVESGKSIAAPKPPEAEGYTFLGWFRDQEASVAWDFDKDTINADMTLYAGWEENTPAPTRSGMLRNGGTKAEIPPDKIKINNIEVIFQSGSDGDWRVGDKGRATVTVEPEDACKDVIWDADPEGIVEIDKDGYFTIIKQHEHSGFIVGTIIVESRVDDAAYDYVQIGRLVPADSNYWSNAIEAVEISECPNADGMWREGNEGQASVRWKSGVTPRTVTWSASHSEAVDIEIDSDGKFRVTRMDSYAQQNFYITATFNVNGVDYSCRSNAIKVFKDKKNVTAVKLVNSPTKLSYVIGEMFDYTGLEVELTYHDGTTGLSKDGEGFHYQPGQDGDWWGPRNTPFQYGDNMVAITYSPYYGDSGTGTIICNIQVSPPQTYPITLDANGGTVNGKPTDTATIGRDGKLTSSLPGAAAMAHPNDNMQFVGWYTEKSGGTAVDTSTVLGANATIYAQWKDNTPVATHAVTYAVEGGSFAQGTETTENVIAGQSPANVPDGMTPDDDHKNTGAWYQGDGDTPVDPAAASITGPTAFTWRFEPKPQHTVSFYDGSTELTALTQTVIDGGYASQPDDPTKDSHSFKGWYADASFQTPFYFTQQAITGDTRVYARFVATYTVTYKVVNGTWSDGRDEVVTEAVLDGQSPAQIPTGMKPSAGYEEGGAWSPDPNGAEIKDDTTFTYTFTKKSDEDEEPEYNINILFPEEAGAACCVLYENAWDAMKGKNPNPYAYRIDKAKAGTLVSLVIILNPTGGVHVKDAYSEDFRVPALEYPATFRYCTEFEMPAKDITISIGLFPEEKDSAIAWYYFVFLDADGNEWYTTWGQSYEHGIDWVPDYRGIVQSVQPPTKAEDEDNTYVFSNWYMASRGNPEWKITYKPVFTAVPKKTVTVLSSPAAGGTVTGGGNYAEGTAATVTATPNEGYRFVGWMDRGVQISSDNPYRFTVTESRTLTAVFGAGSAPLVTSYPLWLGDTQVDSFNKNNILGAIDPESGESTAAYDPVTKTLTLRNPAISGAHEDYKIYSLDSLTIEGKATITGEKGVAVISEKEELNTLTIQNAELDISVQWEAIYARNTHVCMNSGTVNAASALHRAVNIQVHGSFTMNGGELTVETASDTRDALIVWQGNNQQYIEGENNIVVNGGRIDATAVGGAPVWADGVITLPANYYAHLEDSDTPLRLNDGSHRFVDESGEGITNSRIIIEPQVMRYDLWVGGVQVTEANKDNIPGVTGENAKASFDPATNTLTLENVTGVSGSTMGALITAEGIDLTVAGSAVLEDNTVDMGIQVAPGSLTLEGDFTITAGSYGIYVQKDVTMVGGRLFAKGGACGIYSARGELKVKSGTLETEGSMWALGTAPDLSAYSPDPLVMVNKDYNGESSEPWSSESGGDLGGYTSEYKYVKISPASTAPTHSVTLTAYPDGVGQLEGGGSYEENTEITVKATHGIYHVFDGWYNGSTRVSDGLREGSGSTYTYTFTITEDISLTAKFKRLVVFDSVEISGDRTVYDEGEVFSLTFGLIESGASSFMSAMEHKKVTLSLNGQALGSWDSYDTIEVSTSELKEGENHLWLSYPGSDVYSAARRKIVITVRKKLALRLEDFAPACAALNTPYTVSGRIVDEKGDSYSGAEVYIYVQKYAGNEVMFTGLGRQITDAEGRFSCEISKDLPDSPGSRIIRVKVDRSDTHKNLEATPTVQFANSFTVTWKIENGSWKDGSREKQMTVTEGTKLAAADIPAMKPESGFGVGAWDLDPVGQTVSGDVTFTWTYRHFKIRYEMVGDAAIGTPPAERQTEWWGTESREVLGGSALLVRPAILDEQYDFDGTWYTDQACTQQADGWAALDGDVTLYGAWTGPYTVIDQVMLNFVPPVAGDPIPAGQYYADGIGAGIPAELGVTQPGSMDDKTLVYFAAYELEGGEEEAVFEAGKTYTLRVILGLADPRTQRFQGHGGGTPYALSVTGTAGSIASVTGTQTEVQLAVTPVERYSINSVVNPSEAGSISFADALTGGNAITAAKAGEKVHIILPQSGSGYMALDLVCQGDSSGREVTVDMFKFNDRILSASFMMPEEPVTVTARFADIATPRKISVVCEPEGAGTAAASQEEGVYGDMIRLTASAQEGWLFDKWQIVSGAGADLVSAYGLEGIEEQLRMGYEDVSLKALFVEDTRPIVHITLEAPLCGVRPAGASSLPSGAPVYTYQTPRPEATLLTQGWSFATYAENGENMLGWSAGFTGWSSNATSQAYPFKGGGTYTVYGKLISDGSEDLSQGVRVFAGGREGAARVDSGGIVTFYVTVEAVHDWDEPQYDWAGDDSSVSGKVCCRNAACGETLQETVNTTKRITAQATETACAEMSYTAVFTQQPFTTQTKTVLIPKTPLNLGLTISGWTEGEMESQPLLSGNDGNGAVNYSYRLAADPDEEASYSGGLPAVSGDYVLRARVAETVTHKAGEAFAGFTISAAAAISTITFDLDGGTWDGQTGSVSLKVEDGTDIILPEPEKAGHTFDYWEGSRYNAGDSYTVGGDHTFTARWKQNSVTPGGDQPGGDQPGGDQPGGDQPGGDQPGGDQPGGDQPGGDQPGSDQPGGVQPGGDQPGGDQPGGDQPGGDQPGGDQPGGDQPGGDQPGGDQPGGDQPGGDQPGGDQPGGDQPGGDQPGGDQPGGDQPGGDQPGGDQPGGDQPGGDQPGGDEPGGDQPGGDQPGGNEPGGDQPGGDQPGGDQPGGDQPGGDQPGGDQPGGDQPGGNEPGGDQPGGNEPGGDEPGGNEPGGNEPGGNEPGGNEPGGNEPGGNEPGGNEPGGNEPGGNEPGGNEPGGNEPGGNEPGGNEPGGNEPGGNEPGGNEPGGNEPGGNEPGGNEPGGNEPGGNEPGGNEPGGNEPGGNEPGGNEPGGNEPGGNEPGGNEPGGNEPGGNEPGGNEPGGNEPGGNEPGGNEPGGNEPGGNEPGGDQPGGDQPGGNEPGGNESGGNEPGGNEPGGNEPGGNEPGGNEPGGNEPGGNEPGGNEPGGNEPGGNEPGGNEPGGDQPGGNEPGGSDPTQEEPTQEEPTQEEPTQEEPTQEDPTQEEPTQEDPTQEEPTQEDPTQEEPTQEEPTQEAPTQEDSTQNMPGKSIPAMGDGNSLTKWIALLSISLLGLALIWPGTDKKESKRHSR